MLSVRCLQTRLDSTDHGRPDKVLLSWRQSSCFVGLSLYLTRSMAPAVERTAQRLRLPVSAVVPDTTRLPSPLQDKALSWVTAGPLTRREPGHYAPLPDKAEPWVTAVQGRSPGPSIRFFSRSRAGAPDRVPPFPLPLCNGSLIAPPRPAQRGLPVVAGQVRNRVARSVAKVEQGQRVRASREIASPDSEGPRGITA